MSALTPQKVRVTKHFVIDMAHALYGYDGPCKNIHGHTYHLEVTVAGYPIADDTDVKIGMVIDFAQLKEIVNQHIVRQYDHALVLNQFAPYAREEGVTSQFEKVILVPYQPTCENLMLSFLEKIRYLLPEGTTLVAMILRETPTSYAEWRVEDQP